MLQICLTTTQSYLLLFLTAQLILYPQSQSDIITVMSPHNISKDYTTVVEQQASVLIQTGICLQSFLVNIPSHIKKVFF